MKQTIKDVALEYINSEHENNFYAEGREVMIYILGHEVDVETIFYSKDEDKVYLHCGSKEFEGDIDIESLSDANQERMRKSLDLTLEDKEWERIDRLISTANDMLVPCNVAIHVEDNKRGGNHLYYIEPQGDVVSVNEDVKLCNVFDEVSKLWSTLLDLYVWMKQTGGTAKAEVTLHRVSGDTHQGEANLIWSFADCQLFFIHASGAIEYVDGDIDHLMNESGYFAVNVKDYTEAMRQVEMHEAGFDYH